MVELINRPSAPETIPNNYPQIPNLVRKAVLNPKKSGKALRELNAIIANDPNLDPTLFAVNEAQRLILSSSRSEQIQIAAGLMNNAISTSVRKKRISLRVTPKIIEAVESIRQNDQAIRKNKLTENTVGEHNGIENLRILLPQLTDGIKLARECGKSSIDIVTTVMSVKSEKLFNEAIEKTRNHNLWMSRIESVLQKNAGKNETIDELVELLKSEPDLNGETFFTKKYAGKSIEDISGMKYPLELDDFFAVTDLVTQALSNENNKNPSYEKIVSRLFFQPVFFNDLFKKLDYCNSNLFRNINHWREMFAFFLLYGETDLIRRDLQPLLSKLPEGALGACVINASNPFETDPDRENAYAINSSPFAAKHPVMIKAFEDFQSNNPDFNNQVAYLDEIGVNFFNHTLVPLLRKRLGELGLEEKFNGELSKLDDYAKDNAYEKHHLIVLAQVFEENCGKEFLDKLSSRSKEIQEVTEDVWGNTLEKLHFLPMSTGINVVEFSDGSVPNILRLKNIMVFAGGSPQDWRMNVRYNLDNTDFCILGQLDQHGKLTLKAPVEQKIPGLYTLLNHIAVLVFHDLAVQGKSKTAATTPENGHGRSDEDGQPKTDNKSHQRFLPRTQKDSQLVADVYESTHFKPRIVELHTMTLPGAKEYQSAVNLFNEAIAANVSDDQLSWITKELENARKKAHKISKEKKGNIPARFALGKIMDPITNEERFLETWVVEHTSPKPTEEELKSPVKLFERYYKHSSALASLDQMKPWFVGQ